MGLTVIGSHNVGHYIELFVAAEFWPLLVLLFCKMAGLGIWILTDWLAIQFLSIQALNFNFVAAECLVCISVQFWSASIGVVQFIAFLLFFKCLNFIILIKKQAQGIPQQ